MSAKATWAWVEAGRVCCRECTCFDTLPNMTTPRPMLKPVTFLGDNREQLRDFPPTARGRAGFELFAVQIGLDPTHWKPIKPIGPGVREIRIRDEAGAFRVIYWATLADRVLVLRAFQKKTQQTAQTDIDLAARRLKDWRENDGKRDL